MSVGRVTVKAKIFEIKIELREVWPAVVRRVQVPGEMSLAGLHEVAQVAMGLDRPRTCTSSTSMAPLRAAVPTASAWAARLRASGRGRSGCSAG